MRVKYIFKYVGKNTPKMAYSWKGNEMKKSWRKWHSVTTTHIKIHYQNHCSLFAHSVFLGCVSVFTLWLWSTYSWWADEFEVGRQPGSQPDSHHGQQWLLASPFVIFLWQPSFNAFPVSLVRWGEEQTSSSLCSSPTKKELESLTNSNYITLNRDASVQIQWIQSCSNIFKPY